MLALLGAADGTGSVPGRRVAITGLGVIAACGTGKDAFWAGLMAAPVDGERRVDDFDGTPYFGAKEVRRVDRFAQFAVAAADQALADAGGVEGLAVEGGRPTSTKTRVVGGSPQVVSQQIARIDRVVHTEIGDAAKAHIIGYLERELPRVDALIVSD